MDGSISETRLVFMLKIVEAGDGDVIFYLKTVKALLGTCTFKCIFTGYFVFSHEVNVNEVKISPFSNRTFLVETTITLAWTFTVFSEVFSLPSLLTPFST